MNRNPECLEANGLGGFASGTVAGLRMRWYHAILLAATTPPTGRFVLVNGFDASAETPAGRCAISSQRYTPARHRRFLVLDEQDCWLRPDLVPRLVKIVHNAGKALGFQVLMISHHDISAFEQYADKIYQFVPNPAGVAVVERGQPTSNPDESDLNG